MELEHAKNQQLQNEAVAQELAEKRAAEEESQRRQSALNRWNAELANFVNELKQTQSVYPLQGVRDRYVQWLENNQLSGLGQNPAILNRYRSVTFSKLPGWADNEVVMAFAKAIESTHLPALADNFFPKTKDE